MELPSYTYVRGTHFSRGGGDCLQNCSGPKNGFRGGDTFCPSRGGVEGGKGGGQTNFFKEETDNIVNKREGNILVLEQNWGSTVYFKEQLKNVKKPGKNAYFFLI